MDILSRNKNDEHIKPSKGAAAHTEQNLVPQSPLQSEMVVGHHLHGPKHRRSFKEWLRGITKKQWIVTGIVAGVLVIGGGVGLFFLLNKGGKEQPVAEEQKQQTTTPAAESTTVASNLTGLQVDKSVNDRPVTAIMIENSTSARPQSGLLDAGVVFEAIAEGGITRFVTLFQDSTPDYIGPVRSVRPYFIQWALGFDAAIAHAGGSAEALNYMKIWNVKDLNDNSNYFWRINSRAAPHNLYTSIAKLNEYEAKKGYGKANFTPLQRMPEQPSANPTARTIDFNISSSNYNTHYDYDAKTNSYKRSVGGAPHVDAKTGTQLAPKSIVGIIMSKGKNDIYTTYGTIGGGPVIIFQDGVVTEGTWKKYSNTDNFVFADSNGNPLKLIPGQTWFTAMSSRSEVTYSP